MILILAGAGSGIYFGTVSTKSATGEPPSSGAVGSAAPSRSTTSSTTFAAMSDFLATGNGWVTFMHLENDNGTLSGSAQEVNENGQPPNLIASKLHPHGVRHRRRVTRSA